MDHGQGCSRDWWDRRINLLLSGKKKLKAVNEPTHKWDGTCVFPNGKTFSYIKKPWALEIMNANSRNVGGCLYTDFFICSW